MPSFFRNTCVAVVSAWIGMVPPSALAQATSAAAGSEKRVVLVVGDSLAAEYGLTLGTGWVPLMAQRITEQYPKYQVINASISGDTTSGGVSRLPPLLSRYRPAVVMLELGSNDALRGLPADMTDKNLREMTQAAKQVGARVVLVGMQIPPNYGRQYADQFKAVFGDVAKATNAALVPFLMEGVAADRRLFQSDGLHPNEGAQKQLLENVWPAMKAQLR
jgi:acyl-CoA thioesterase-1